MGPGTSIDLVYPNERTLFKVALVFSLLVWTGLILGTVGLALVYALFAFVGYLFAHSAFIAYLKGTAVRITAEQYQDLDTMVREAAQKIGMANVPEAYLLHGNGVFNAFATRFLRRDFIVLYSDVVDALGDRPDAIKFYIGHELGHLHRRHLTFAPLLLPARILPLLGAAYSRAREYTCDRYGFACSGTSDGAAIGLAALAAGGKRWRTLDPDRYVAQLQETSGFWMSFHELIGSYPWLVKRVAAVQSLAGQRSAAMPRRSVAAGILAFMIPGGATGAAALLPILFIVMATAAISARPFLEPLLQSKALGTLGTSEPDYVAQQLAGETAAHPASPQAAINAALDATNSVRTAIETYVTTHQKWPADNAVLKVDAISTQYGNDVAMVTVTDGIVEVLFAHPALAGKSITLTSDFKDGAVTWGCSTKTIAAEHLPSNCAVE